MLKLITYLSFAAQLISTFSSVDAYGRYLYATEWLANGSSIRYFPVAYLQYKLTMQSNCDFVFTDATGSSLWSSETAGQGVAGQCYVIMQKDCNLVIYPDNASGPGYGSPALWSSATDGMGEGCYLWIGVWDGLVMGTLWDSSENILWSTNAQ